MTTAILRRAGTFAVTLVVASMIVFFLLSSLPGDPARVMLGVQADEAQVAQLREQLGLNRPLLVQYLDWMMHFITGNFGTSRTSGIDMGAEIADALAITAMLILAAILLALIIAIPAGIYAAVRSRQIDGAVISGIAQVGISIPGFLAGAIYIAVFAVLLQWLPSGGWVSPEKDFGQFLSRLILPALALASVQGSILTRYVRSSVLEVMNEDFLRTARSKGLTRLQSLFRHGLRNAAIPVVTVIGVQLAALLIGAVPVERVFSIPGLGDLLLQKVSLRDLPAIQNIVMVLVIIILAINFIVDLIYTVIDPRLRRTS